MAIRLAQIITSLNISRDRAVEFLQKKNLISGEISDNPKLTPEQENALMREFSSDMAAKEKAEQFIKPKDKKEKKQDVQPRAEKPKEEKPAEKPAVVAEFDAVKAKAKAEAEAKRAAEEEAAAKQAKAKAIADA
ncbi:MAG: hypothetical protein HUJ65_00525, partial [Oscillospiraceae bacterium]|nr:hypothetical protein [Oscillospiraceae bacterium]